MLFRVLALLPLLALSGQAHPSALLAPIPLWSEDPGQRWDAGPADSPVRLEIFLELLCSDSEYSWPIMQDLSAYYGDNLALIVHQFVLPYHRNAYLTAEGFYQVLDKEGQSAAWDYMDAMFAARNSFTDSATRDMTETEIVSDMADVTAAATNIDSQDFIDDLYSYDNTAKNAWKYGVKRGAAGTPWFVVNNVNLEVNSGIRMDFDDWVGILDPLMP